MTGEIVAGVSSDFIAVGVILATKFKCLFNTGFCKLGCIDTPLAEQHEVEIKKENINGVEVAYVSKNSVNIEADSDEEESYYDYNVFCA
jgi:hypothetical protein